MDNEAMMNRAKQLVVDYFNAHVDVTDGKKLTIKDVMKHWTGPRVQAEPVAPASEGEHGK